MKIGLSNEFGEFDLLKSISFNSNHFEWQAWLLAGAAFIQSKLFTNLVSAQNTSKHPIISFMSLAISLNKKTPLCFCWQAQLASFSFGFDYPEVSAERISVTGVEMEEWKLVLNIPCQLLQ